MTAKRKQPPCRCPAYLWPHREFGGICEGRAWEIDCATVPMIPQTEYAEEQYLDDRERSKDINSQR